MAAQRRGTPAAGDVPEAHGAVHARAGQALASGAEAQAIDRVAVGLLTGAGCGRLLRESPGAHGLVAAGGDRQPLPTQREGVDGTAMTAIDAPRSTVALPAAHGPIHAARDQPAAPGKRDVEHAACVSRPRPLAMHGVGGQAKDHDAAVGPARGEASALAIEGQRRDDASMGRTLPALATATRIPEAYRTVVARRGDGRTIGREDRPRYRTPVTPQTHELATVGAIEERERSVAASAEDASPRGVEADAPDRPAMGDDAALLDALGQAPQADFTVPGASRHARAVGRIGHAEDLIAMAAEHAVEPSPSSVEEVDPAVLTGHRQLFVAR